MGHIYARITCTRVKWEEDVSTLAEAEGVESDVIRQRHSTGWRVDGRTGRIEYDDDGSGDFIPTSDTIQLEEPVEEHGWVEQSNSRTLYDSRNDVRPAVSEAEDSEDLAPEVQNALEWLEGGYEDSGDGTFYATDSYKPYTDPWEYSYALHFVRKFHNGTKWVEEPWHPFKDGCLMWHEGELTGPHADYPHSPGTLHDCYACEKIMDEGEE